MKLVKHKQRKKKITYEKIEAIYYQEGKPTDEIVEELVNLVCTMRKKFFGAGFHRGYRLALQDVKNNSVQNFERKEEVK